MKAWDSGVFCSELILKVGSNFETESVSKVGKSLNTTHQFRVDLIYSLLYSSTLNPASLRFNAEFGASRTSGTRRLNVEYSSLGYLDVFAVLGDDGVAEQGM